MPLLPRTLLGLLLTLVLLPAVPAAAGSPTPGPGPAPTTRTAASVLEAEVARQQRALRTEDARLAAAVRAADAALEARQQAERAAGQARREADVAVQQLAAARARVARAKAALAGFAGALYRNGSAGQKMSYLQAALVTRDPARLLHDVELAEQVGDGRGQAYDAFQAAEAGQRAAAQRAQQAQQRAAALQRQAEQRQQAAQAAVATQIDLVALRRQVLASTVDQAAAARRREDLLAKAEQIALERSRAGIPASALAGALVPRPSGTCEGGDLSGYANGLLPVEALCPLWGTAGQVLRADAAAAFNDMSKAYAEESGVPLCVTDSYRNLAEQIAVRQAKPHLAAVPGTSNHGWGVALDLCDGVQTFDTPVHLWLVENASRFGWFLPAWAQKGGSKPEPWHWEFAG